MKKPYYMHNGSIILMILFFITALSAITYSSLRTTSYFLSLSREREKYEIHYQMVQSLHNFVVAEQKNQFKKDLPASVTVLFKGPWPDAKSHYNGEVWLDTRKTSIKTINSVIKKNKKNIISLKTYF